MTSPCKAANPTITCKSAEYAHNNTRNSRFGIFQQKAIKFQVDSKREIKRRGREREKRMKTDEDVFSQETTEIKRMVAFLKINCFLRMDDTSFFTPPLGWWPHGFQAKLKFNSRPSCWLGNALLGLRRWNQTELTNIWTSDTLEVAAYSLDCFILSLKWSKELDKVLRIATSVVSWRSHPPTHSSSQVFA